jgi:periplasmic protein TonB
MFETAVLANPSKRVWSTCAGMTAQALLVLAVCLAPIIRPDVLPRAQTLISLVAPGPPTRPETSTPPRELVRAVPTRLYHPDSTLVLPGTPPPHPELIEDPPTNSSEPCVGCIPGKGGPPNSLLAQIMNTPPVVQVHEPEKPAAGAQPTVTAPIRLRGGDVRLAHPVYRVEPRYPQPAIFARISGAVELEGIIGTDGRIRNLHALSGNPLLVPAALEAVRQWVYEPTLLNGKPVEVIAPITVIFRLSR